MSLPNFSSHLLVRYGAMRELASVEFATDQQIVADFARGQLVVVDCGRGPELAEVVSANSRFGNPASGRFIRNATAQDELLHAHLERISTQVTLACSEQLAEQNRTETIVSIEVMLDCQTLFFHFLQPPDNGDDQLLHSLRHTFQTEFNKDPFVQKVLTGCGPGCGSLSASKCGSNCSSCTLSCKLS